MKKLSDAINLGLYQPMPEMKKELMPYQPEINPNAQQMLSAQSFPSAMQNTQPQPEPKQSMLIRDCQDSQNKLTGLLYQVFMMQKGYGESPEDMAKREKAFQWKLGRFTFDQVLEAMERYTDVKSDIPAPADIVQILDPEPEPLSNAMYVQLCKKAVEGYLSSDEQLYRKTYESLEIDKAKSWQ